MRTHDTLPQGPNTSVYDSGEDRPLGVRDSGSSTSSSCRAGGSAPVVGNGRTLAPPARRNRVAPHLAPRTPHSRLRIWRVRGPLTRPGAR
jgi:hypothetical protein